MAAIIRGSVEDDYDILRRKIIFCFNTSHLGTTDGNSVEDDYDILRKETLFSVSILAISVPLMVFFVEDDYDILQKENDFLF